MTGDRPNTGEIMITVSISQITLAALTVACENLLAFVAEIRYRDWPSEGCGIGLCPEEMEKLMKDTERALRTPRAILYRARIKEVTDYVSAKVDLVPGKE